MFLKAYRGIFLNNMFFFNESNFDKLYTKIAIDWFLMTGNRNKHLFHLVTPSPWPYVMSMALLATTVGSALYFHFYTLGGYLSAFGLILVLLTSFTWWRDVVREATFLGYHSSKVRAGLKLGFIFFVLSEVMFFVSWFWAYFHASLAPAIELGAMWPPVGFDNSVCINPMTVPLLNTIVLVVSGITVTWSHKAIRINNYTSAFYGLVLTIALGLEFTALQAWEYISAPFAISDSVYGSTFYMITGFHGFHVICGTLFLIVCAYRMWRGQLSQDRHIGYEFAIWYWHFVDIIWLFVYTFLYWWGSTYALFN